ncbi:OLC1v1035613C1 [Oldenlandia corymbosa var. corymbosa]|uniref:OLC1v1035613C1 n=1 Tax=Oldenlandia corymbosa var. corymbosa TaxID=529605 RepID=A0AAV1CU28_OLDCO|nr:OLC1v1035613C1 [Oldenlandia corymbosa var. corymbosa]
MAECCPSTMAPSGGLARLSVEDEAETGWSRANAAGNVVCPRVFFNPSIDAIAKFRSDSFNESKNNHSGVVVSFTSSHLRNFTSNFSHRIGPYHFGEVYHGTIKIGEKTRSVVVKTWDDNALYLESLIVPYIFIEEEVMFLKDKMIASHPNIVKVIGKCCEENLRAVVYDLDALDTLHHMIPKDDFNWVQRIRVAFKFAQLLEFLHCQVKPYVVLNLSSEHIMLDKMLNPLLFDFGLLSGGVIGELSDLKRRVCPPLGYGDPQFLMGGPCLPRCDVYVYGMILIGIIAKKVVEEKELHNHAPALDVWANEEYKTGTSLVHKSLQSESGYYTRDALSVTELGMWCIQEYGADRPNMTQVVEHLKKLQIVKDLELE